ncbi:MAG: hypothetical protein C5S47_03585 [Candidatus Methanogasteraceae archaeon]|nr:MAG: hypothetical protein C5S47_03585 [ANME-2 cluster archaeon]
MGPIQYGVYTSFHHPRSCLYSDDPNDIDIGIYGMDPENLFKFYGELSLEIPERIDIDIVTLDKDNLFNRLVEKEGMKLYG